MAYPSTNLAGDVQDAPYGGAPANRFGTPARQFIDSVLQFLEAAYLKYLRQPWMTWTVVCASGCSTGDVAVLSEGQFVSASGYAVNKVAGTGIALPNQVIGVFLEAVSAGNKGRLAFCGILPPSITGLGLLAQNAPVTVDGTTGRLRLAAANEPILGYGDIQGNCLLLAPGRLI